MFVFRKNIEIQYTENTEFIDNYKIENTKYFTHYWDKTTGLDIIIWFGLRTLVYRFCSSKEKTNQTTKQGRQVVLFTFAPRRARELSHRVGKKLFGKSHHELIKHAWNHDVYRTNLFFSCNAQQGFLKISFIQTAQHWVNYMRYLKTTKIK